MKSMYRNLIGTCMFHLSKKHTVGVAWIMEYSTGSSFIYGRQGVGFFVLPMEFICFTIQPTILQRRSMFLLLPFDVLLLTPPSIVSLLPCTFTQFTYINMLHTTIHSEEVTVSWLRGFISWRVEREGQGEVGAEEITTPWHQSPFPCLSRHCREE